MSIQLGPPSHVLLMLTYRCNLRCPYCLVFDPVRYWAADSTVPLPTATPQREMTSNEIIGRVIPQCEQAGVQVIALTGGEIMVRRDFVEIVDGLGRSDLTWCVDTNLSRCSADMAERIIKARCDTVFVSIDGPEEIHNKLRGSNRAHAAAVQGLGNVLDARRAKPLSRTEIVANCVLQQGNEGVPPDLARWAHDQGLDGICYQLLSAKDYSPGFDATRALTALAEAKKIGADLGINVTSFPLADPSLNDLQTWYSPPVAGQFFADCRYIHSSMRIDPGGNVIPCVEHTLGNILEHDLLEIWRGEPFSQFRNHIAGGPLVVCERCCNMSEREAT